MIITTLQWLAEVGEKSKTAFLLGEAFILLAFILCCFVVLILIFFGFFLLTNFPSSFAEFGGIGSANSPWTANLGLCARMAHQTGA